MAGSQLLAQGIDRRRAILRFIKSYIKKNAIPPSLDEIAQGTSQTLSTARYHVQILCDEGFLAQTPGKYRSLRVVREGRYPA